MKIKVSKPHPDYPLAYIHVDLSVDTDRQDLADILAKNRITLIGRWEPLFEGGSIDGMKAPALLEDEHTKPRKKAVRKTQRLGLKDIRA